MLPQLASPPVDVNNDNVTKDIHLLVVECVISRLVKVASWSGDMTVMKLISGKFTIQKKL